MVMSFLFGRKQLDGKRVVEGSVLLKNMRCELNFYLPTTPTYVQGMCDIICHSTYMIKSDIRFT